MFVIGERINGMYRKVLKAIEERNSVFIEELALSQVKAGAGALDISVGPLKGDHREYMKWLVGVVSSVVDVPLSIDSPYWEVIRVGVENSANPTIINSVKRDEEQIINLLPLAADKGCKVILLLMDKSGIPSSEEKIEIAAYLLEKAMEYGISVEDLFFDPILLPIMHAQKDVAETFQTMDNLRLLIDPPPHIIVGLSNLSQKAKYRSLLNRTYCAMAMSHGLDAAILDPLDEKLMKTIKAADILLNRKLYARSFLKGFSVK